MKGGYRKYDKHIPWSLDIILPLAVAAIILGTAFVLSEVVTCIWARIACLNHAFHNSPGNDSSMERGFFIAKSLIILGISS